MISSVDWHLTGELSTAAGKVASLLKAAAPLGVAFSGGVDSSVLLALAVRALGADHVVAILGVSPSLGSDERLAAHQVAAFIGARLIEVQTREGDNPAYRANGPDRCFHCKNELFTRIADEVAGAYNLKAVAYGENADDAMRPDRPGARAAANHEVLRPLADAGLGKVTVRAIDRALQLPSADKQIVKIGGLAHTAILGVNRARFYHALHSFLSMPARVDLEGKKGSGAGHA